jgi:hypothetical protein
MGSFSKRQCRDRWQHYLSPTIIRSPWTYSEGKLLLEIAARFGYRWFLMTKWFPGRTAIEIRNHYLRLLRKRPKLVLPELPKQDEPDSPEQTENVGEEKEGESSGSNASD